MGLFECLQRRCATDELDELWRVEYDLIEEGYFQFAKSRGIDASHEILQVFAGPFEPKFCEYGEDERVGGGGRRSGRDRGDWNSSQSSLRLFKVERAATIASGEKYPE
jgi:hypothetical protein